MACQTPEVQDARESTQKFGAALKEKRQHLGLSQEGLALKSGLDRSYVGGIERGERNPSLTAITRLADGLGISMHELFQYTEPDGR
jgi:transcriptional regulator with XRE-family HTH domain